MCLKNLPLKKSSSLKDFETSLMVSPPLKIYSWATGTYSNRYSLNSIFSCLALAEMPLAILILFSNFLLILSAGVCMLPPNLLCIWENLVIELVDPTLMVDYWLFEILSWVIVLFNLANSLDLFFVTFKFESFPFEPGDWMWFFENIFTPDEIIFGWITAFFYLLFAYYDKIDCLF
jgi:hypothetical protein